MGSFQIGSRILTSSFSYIYNFSQKPGMSNRHFRRWLFKLPLAFLFIAAGIAAIMYPIYYERPHQEWMMWGGASIGLFIIGLLFFGSALVHKVKSDLIKRTSRRFKIMMEEDDEED